MSITDSWPILGAAFLIFGLRIVDVSLGTLRTLAVVNGQIRLSVVLGFFEILVWITAVSQLFAGVTTNPLLMLAYSAGFAGGNAMGIVIERKFPVGDVTVRILASPSPTSGQIAAILDTYCSTVAVFQGEAKEGPRVLIHALCHRKLVPKVIADARSLDPNLVFSVESVRQWGGGHLQSLPYATGWRSIFKKK